MCRGRCGQLPGCSVLPHRLLFVCGAEMSAWERPTGTESERKGTGSSCGPTALRDLLGTFHIENLHKDIHRWRGGSQKARGAEAKENTF